MSNRIKKIRANLTPAQIEIYRCAAVTMSTACAVYKPKIYGKQAAQQNFTISAAEFKAFDKTLDLRQFNAPLKIFTIS